MRPPSLLIEEVAERLVTVRRVEPTLDFNFALSVTPLFMLCKAELLAAVNALGGEAIWGIEQLIPGRMHADPGVLIEQLLPRVLQMLNEIMDATPVERLSGVSISPKALRPPTKDFPDTFSEINRQSIRWQLGL